MRIKEKLLFKVGNDAPPIEMGEISEMEVSMLDISKKKP
jgi:hypothetical protein